MGSQLLDLLSEVKNPQTHVCATRFWSVTFRNMLSLKSDRFRGSLLVLEYIIGGSLLVYRNTIRDPILPPPIYSLTGSLSGAHLANLKMRACITPASMQLALGLYTQSS